MFKSLPAAAAIILALGARPALADPALSTGAAALPGDGTYVTLATLAPNPVNTTRTIVAAGEAAGIDQIRGLVGSSRLEEQWAFVPAAGLWIEVGRNELADNRTSEVELDLDFLAAIATLHDDVMLVHFHPAQFYREHGWDRVRPATARVAGWSAEEMKPIALSLPSTDDVMASITANAAIAQAAPGARLRHMVVTPHGTVTYGLTDRGLKRILFDRGNPVASPERAILYRYALLQTPRNPAHVASGSAATVGDILATIAGQVSDDDYEVTFRPFDRERW